MLDTEKVPVAAIAKLNDELRASIPHLPYPHQMVLTDEVATLPTEQLAELLYQVKNFCEFSEDNDPHGEHDFGKIMLRGDDFFWKFDYYDQDQKYFEENGQRILTIMFAHEY